SRVFVNRVWQQYFGVGIVATPDNFGRSGAEPTHPELFDWLATEFVARGWSVKDLHRLIVRSTAYRQATERPRLGEAARGGATGGQPPAPADPESVDPDNTLLWRMPLRRLESEIARDCILAVSGALDASPYGPPVPLKPYPDGRVEVDVERLS